MLGVAYGLRRKLRAEFLVTFTKVGISGRSLDFSDAKYGWTYGREWLIYVKCFVCYCSKFNNMLTMCMIC